MSRRTRIFVGVLLIYVAGFAFLLYRATLDIDPRYRESAEEALVETAQLLASLIEQDAAADGAIHTGRIDRLLRDTYARQFSAQIYALHKTRVELRVYVTDRAGWVLYDSLGSAVGTDFSRRADVGRTLAGLYGARTTRDVPADPLTSVMYVAAPIHAGGEIVGVVSVGKPVQSFGQFVADARSRTLWVGIGSALALLLLALIVSVWLVRPFGLVRDTVAWARTQQQLRLGAVLRRALVALRGNFGEMRDALTGRNYVTDYVQTLTHEVKSPLSAIRGAAELLEDPAMPQPERERFLANISRETQRIQEIVDRMMELTALEARRVLGATRPVDLAVLLREVATSAQAAAAARGVQVTLAVEQPAVVEGDAFLLRRAVDNLLDNAIDFAPVGSTVDLSLHVAGRTACACVRDRGPGVPDYARDKVFEKFYSLARPQGRKKSTGLGLAFVREIAALHRGRATLGNAADGGALATLELPITAH